MRSLFSKMKPAGRSRRTSALAAAVASTVMIAAIGAAVAQTKIDAPIVLEIKGTEKPDDIARAVDALRRDGKTVTIRIADPAASKPAAEPAPAKPDASAGPTHSAPPMSDWSVFLAQFVQALRDGAPSIRAIPTLKPDFSRAWSDTSLSATGTWLTLLAALAISIGVGWAGHRLAARALALQAQHCTAMTASRMALSIRRLVVDIAGAAAALIALRLLCEWWIPSARIAAVSAGAVQQALGAAALYIMIGRFLLAPGDPQARLLRLPRADYHFRFFLVYVGMGQLIFILLTLADATASQRIAVGGLFFVLSTAIAIYKIWWFWMARNDIETLVLSAAKDPERPTIALRFAAKATAWIFIAATTMIWVVARVAVMMADGARWAWAAGITQFIVVLLPIVAIGATHLARDLHVYGSDQQAPSPLRRAIGAVLEKAAGGGVWLVGLFILARMWGDFFMESGSQMIITQIRDLVVVAEILVAGYLILVFFHVLFEAYRPKPLASLPTDEDAHDQVQTRIGSVLPILRGFSLGAIVGLTILVTLSKLGVDIGPLLAGFGILGLAISFGSQALVRDIVSGLFFMVEDAFRVGEYIDTGRLRGTVEKISLRSVQLRHQSGQVHTIPFGQIASITNASRDWATVKFNIKVDRATDLEKARKAIKKTGLAMLEDPEIGKDFILPLKLQGVQEILDTGIVLRLKFTAKPAQSSYLQRESLKRVYRALNEAGVMFASNAVTVMRSIDDMSAAAASVSLAQRAANAPAA